MRIVEDGILGQGQLVEKRMAEELCLDVVEIDWQGFDLIRCSNMYKEAILLVLRRKLEENLGPF